MFDVWMILAAPGILALVVGVGLGMARKTRRAGLVILVVGATFLCVGALRAWHRNNVVMSVAKAHQRVQKGMTKAEVQTLLGVASSIASADSTGKVQAALTSLKDSDILGATLSWEYRPCGGLHSYRVYFDGDGRVVGKAAD